MYVIEKRILKKFYVDSIGNDSQEANLKSSLARLMIIESVKEKIMSPLKREIKKGENIKFKNILIVTYGRSGSTLLQGILNSIEGCLIRGENFNFVYHLFKSYEAILSAKNRGILLAAKKKVNTPQTAWYGSNLLNDEYFIEVLRVLLKKLLLADNINNNRISCYGFKEIRYINIIDDLLDYLDFLKRVFPDAAFIFNFRNIDNVSKSGWWKNKDKKELKESLKKFEYRCLTYINNNNNFCFCIQYEDVVKKSQRLKELFKFLGVEYDVNKIDYILSLPHSYDPQQKYVKDIFNQYCKNK